MKVSPAPGRDVTFHPEDGDIDCLRCGKSLERRVTSDVRHEGPASFMTIVVACGQCGGKTTREFDCFGKPTLEPSYTPA